MDHRVPHGRRAGQLGGGVRCRRGDRRQLRAQRQEGRTTASVQRSSARAAGGRVAIQATANGDTAGDIPLVRPPYQPDLSVAPADIEFSNPHPLVGDTISISRPRSTISACDPSTARCPFTVAFYDDDGLIHAASMLRLRHWPSTPRCRSPCPTPSSAVACTQSPSSRTKVVRSSSRTKPTTSP